MILIILGLAIGTLLAWHPVFIIFTLFFIPVILVSRETSKQYQIALQSIKKGEMVEGVATIKIEIPFDDETYYAIAKDKRNQTWRFNFRPLGWEPKAGITTQITW